MARRRLAAVLALGLVTLPVVANAQTTVDPQFDATYTVELWEDDPTGCWTSTRGTHPVAGEALRVVRDYAQLSMTWTNGVIWIATLEDKPAGSAAIADTSGPARSSSYSDVPASIALVFNRGELEFSYGDFYETCRFRLLAQAPARPAPAPPADEPSAPGAGNTGGGSTGSSSKEGEEDPTAVLLGLLGLGGLVTVGVAVNNSQKKKKKKKTGPPSFEDLRGRRGQLCNELIDIREAEFRVLQEIDTTNNDRVLFVKLYDQRYSQIEIAAYRTYADKGHRIWLYTLGAGFSGLVGAGAGTIAAAAVPAALPAGATALTLVTAGAGAALAAGALPAVAVATFTYWAWFEGADGYLTKQMVDEEIAKGRAALKEGLDLTLSVLQNRMDALRKQLAEIRSKRALAEAGLERLRSQFVEAGLTFPPCGGGR